MNEESTLRNFGLAMSVIAVVLLAVNLVIVVPLYTATQNADEALAAKIFGGDTSAATLSRTLGEEEEDRTLTVTGTGVAKASPDRVIVVLGVTTRSDTAADAQKLNSEKMSNIIEALKSVGVEEDQMETTDVGLSPVWQYPEYGIPIIAGYESHNNLKLTLERLDMAGTVIDAAVSAGANSVSYVSFTLSEEATERLQLEALALAVREAKSRADVVAEGAGITLSGPVSITIGEGYIPYPSPIYKLEAGMTSTPVLPPSELSVTATVTMVYEIA
ncbi:MAG: SIMPL domain-containing protein [Candidatus Bathyarchaeia archaeon]